MRAICIHGHFYQPPRENPWLESIELQESAHPYHDWNERVTAECYAPNGAARILDPRGRIEKIVNNYARISFNFGPTLLTWMQESAPETYQAILDGDRASIARFNGHGSAIAQAYNHMIMPLANRRDKQTQVRWGVRDFEKRFGRRPEGMWLPETAVDLETLDLLLDEGIRFTILAPYQAKRIRSGHGEWQNVGERIDTTRPYFCRLPSGRAIALFFYDSPTSRGVAFEGLLNNGERFAQRLLSNSEGPVPRLVNIATDGESYGHHHRYGDMALASALDVLEAHPEVRLTNYAQFLSLYPPLDEVEIVEYSSWSCAHGIERWRSDCGCRTGGEASWNQSWRGPVRDALDWLRDHLAPLFEREGLRLLRDPWAARDAYIDVVLDRSDDSVQKFVAEYALNEHTGTDLVQMLQLLEMQRQAMLMYTSCGWFFNEVSGIETVQVLQYAARAIQLAKETAGADLEESFLARLSLAKSNLVAVDNAGALYETEVKASMLDLTRVAAHYAVSSLFHEYPSSARIYCYEVDRDDQVVFEAGRPHVIVGRVHVQSMITRATRLFSWGALHLGDLNLSGGVREFIDETAYQTLIDALAEPFHNGDFSGVIRILDREFGTLTFSVKSLFSDEQRRILEASWSSSLADADPLSRELYERYVPLMRYHAELGIPLPRILRVAVEFAFNMHLRRLLDKENPPIAQLRSILQEVRNEKIELDQATLSFSVQRELAAAVEELGEDPRSIASVRRLDHLLEIASLLPFGVDLWKAQNVFFHLLQVVMPEFVERTGNGDEQARIWLRHFRSIGNRLSVRDS
jgi:alpha-amylase/alpha-mannosidase (GH57 family)